MLGSFLFDKKNIIYLKYKSYSIAHTNNRRKIHRKQLVKKTIIN